MGASSFFVGNEAKRGSREDRFIEFEGFCCCGSEGGARATGIEEAVFHRRMYWGSGISETSSSSVSRYILFCLD